MGDRLRSDLTEDQIDALLAKVSERACQTSFHRLYTLTSSRLLRVICRINTDRAEAEEVLQETYILIWSRRGHFDRTRGQALSWLSSIAHNQAVSSLRRRSARPAVVASFAEDSDPFEHAASTWHGPERRLSEAQRGYAVRKCLHALPSSHRETLMLAYYDGLSQVEIAKRLGRPLGTVKSWVRRAMASMSSSMAAHREA